MSASAASEGRKRSAVVMVPNVNTSVANHADMTAVGGGVGGGGQQSGQKSKTPFLIGVAGGTASGKSTVCRKIMEKLGQDTVDHRHQQVVCISQDSFYRELTPDEVPTLRRPDCPSELF